MGFVALYVRVIEMLGADRALAVRLALAGTLLAGLSFLEPVLFGRVIDSLSTGGPPEAVWARTITLLAIWGGVGVAGIGANVLVALHADRLAHRNRLAMMSRFFQHVLHLPLSFHGDAHSGRLLKVMLTGADNMFWTWLGFFREHLTTFVMVATLLPLTLVMNWRLGLLLIVLSAVFAAAAAVAIKRTQTGQAEVEGHHAALATSAGDALSNVVVVQSFVRLKHEAALFGDTVSRLLAAQYPVLTWWAALSVLTRASSTVCVIAIFSLGTWLNLRGQASVGEIVTFMGFATMLVGRLEQAMGFVNTLFMHRPGLLRFFEVMDTPSTVPEKPGAIELARPAGEVRFEEVGFFYPGGPRILDGVGFTAAPGRTVALVGATGAGKSTAMALLQRLWDPQAGRITIDGTDIRDVTLESLRRNIGVVFQESMLFNRSIADNLRIGRPEATDAELEAACRLAEAHEFIERQPQGYATMVGERGSTLSGGQRQRLAIARAALKDPPILILDEATSALDAATEARVSRALSALMAGRTTFIIAHRLSTVREADVILVFDRGRVVERGDFATLVKAGGIFAELVRTQLAPAA
ncbi:MAG: glucan ABC transporter ATP-binding protein/ permease [Acetobacteraceae bacterium]|nr:glucan ABC transporter ATP-binding protein/ permease [Acetobacteraceae bacterium]